MIRIILIALLFYLVYTLLTFIFRSVTARPVQPPPEKTRVGEDMVRDPECGTYVPRGDAVGKHINGAQHYFCSVCGIYTHHRRRSDPNEIGVNLACLDGHTPFLPEVLVHDGQNHPNDIGRAQDDGRLVFIPQGGES